MFIYLAENNLMEDLDTIIFKFKLHAVNKLAVEICKPISFV